MIRCSRQAETIRRGLTSAALPGLVLGLSNSPALATSQLADNGAVLAQFAQASGGPAPELVNGEDGTTQIERHGSATVDF